MIDSGEVRWDTPPAPVPREALRVFHANYEALDERVNRVGEDVWKRPSKLYVGGDLFMEQPLGGFLWYLFFDAIRHQGQLSTVYSPDGRQGAFDLWTIGDNPAVRTAWLAWVYRKAYAFPCSPAEPSQFDSTRQVAIRRGQLPRSALGRIKIEAVFWSAAVPLRLQHAG